MNPVGRANVPSRCDRVALPEDLRKELVRLRCEHGYCGARKLLRLSDCVLEEALDPQAMLRPKTVAKVRERLLELGKIVA
jgi:hypothetical protein